MSVLNKFSVVDKLNGTHCHEGIYCPEGYHCYKVVGFKLPRFCFPDGLDPSKDLSEYMREQTPPLTTHHMEGYTILDVASAVLMVLNLLLLIANLVLVVRRTRRIRVDIGDVPKYTYDYAQNRPPPDSAQRAQIHTPANTTSGPQDQHHTQYNYHQQQRPVSSPLFPRQLVPDHLAHMAYNHNHQHHQQHTRNDYYLPPADTHDPYEYECEEETYFGPQFKRADPRMASRHSMRSVRKPTRPAVVVPHEFEFDDEVEAQPHGSHSRSVSFRRYNRPTPQATNTGSTSNAGFDPMPPAQTSDDDTVEAGVEKATKAGTRVQKK